MLRWSMLCLQELKRNLLVSNIAPAQTVVVALHAAHLGRAVLERVAGSWDVGVVDDHVGHWSMQGLHICAG